MCGGRTHAIQRLLNRTVEEQRRTVTSVIARVTVILSINMYGNHVIQKCLAKFSSDEIEVI